MTRTHHPAPAATTATAPAATVSTAAATVTTATPRRGPAERDIVTAATPPRGPAERDTATAAGARRQAAPWCRWHHLARDGGPLVLGRRDRAGGRFGGVQ